jgi:hypothetical protein
MSNDSPRPRFNVKGFTSLVLMVAFLIMAVSGIMLYVSPRGRVANWTDWTILGLGKHEWAAMHMNSVFIFLIASIFHLVWNWKMFWGYIKKKAAGLNLKIEMLLALIIGVLVVGGTIAYFPPFDLLDEGNIKIMDYWENWAAAAPMPHAEELTLAEFADEFNMSVDDLIAVLKAEGFESATADSTLGDIAAHKGVAPAALFDALRTHYPEIDQRGRGRGRGPGRGAGQGRGQGMGRGMGQGMGRGRRGGRGPVDP